MSPHPTAESPGRQRRQSGPGPQVAKPSPFMGAPMGVCSESALGAPVSTTLNPEQRQRDSFPFLPPESIAQRNCHERPAWPEHSTAKRDTGA